MMRTMRPALSPRFSILVLVLVLFTLPAMSRFRPRPVHTTAGRTASVEGLIFLRVPLPRHNGFAVIARRYTGSSHNARTIERYNRRPRRGRLLEARIPLHLLTARYMKEALSALFPRDRRTADGWGHVWGASPLGKRESWADVARWFSGGSKFANNLANANRKAGRHPKPGTHVTIPDGLLMDAMRKNLKAPPPPPGPGLPSGGPERSAPKPGKAPGKPPGGVKPSAPEARPEDATQSLLTYGKDAHGPYAIYRLRAGEALYSAVVVRFTGSVSAGDVNALALEIAKRSDIKDVTSIPVGYPIKIPLDDLLPQYLPHTDSRYLAWAKNQAEMSKVTNTYKSAVLDGVVVILDPGHGGLDRGAMAHGVWEDSYVYDIACRIYEGLERRTKARVLMTLLVPRLGYRPQDKRKLEPNTGAVILTHPWFHQTSRDETRVEVNLRWHLANQYFERLEKEGIDPQRVVFTSIHADSLHPSLRGSMFYVPGDSYRSKRWCSKGALYKHYEEYRAQPCYRLSSSKMRRSEGLSSQFAKDLEHVFSRNHLLLHPYDPTRDHVIRGRRSWLPAVLRNSIIPCSVLIEVCNLNNAKDARLIADPAYRQAVADAYIDALIRYYS
jgi:N-acetylmuramoyl-L-alanine amidase